MPDYGHPLSFGTFVTPRSADPQHVVRLARHAEHVGLDLISLQDHPYQPAFLDTWTALTWIAAHTERIAIAPNVLNLPLRPPAVVARSTASLDLLSEGRVELGLGAGAFWPAIEAMGGGRLTPGQAVDALTEAIAVIRALWGAPGPGVHVAGTHYSLDGAKPGPEPAHRISIWLGAYKPRMLRLTGATADGWLPSTAYLGEGDLERGNAAVDVAAIEAGRSPGDVRRLLNLQGTFDETGDAFVAGPPEAWVERLLPLATEQGISTFILMADDERTIETFAGEVAPALRDAVAAAR